MSNHSGSYLLNEILTEIFSLGLCDSLTDDKKERLVKKLRALCRE